MNFRTLKADEIDVKVGTVGDGYYTVLLYKNARVDMAILDETVEAENWQRDHKEVKGNLYCGIGILFANQGWVWKWDCGVESDFGDKQKGEASDSFKRAGFNWGIGRELYTSPKVYINCETTTEDGKHYKIKNGADIRQSNNLKVKEIEYNEKREITKLVIVDNEGVQVYPKNNFKQTKKIENIITEPKEIEIDPYDEDKLNCCYQYCCYQCGKALTQKVASYSFGKYGMALCYDCQKKVGN